MSGEGAPATVRGGCPVSHRDHSQDGPVHSHYAQLDQEREQSRFWWNDRTESGFWMLTRYDDVRRGLQPPAPFSTEVTNALNPERAIDLLPQQLDGEPHRKLRAVLNPFFSPSAVGRMAPSATRRCVELIEQLRPKGGCDFVAEFAIRYPTDIFLDLLGLPVSDGEFFLPWVETIFDGFFGGSPAASRAAAAEVMAYFEQVLADRRAHPRDPREDLVSHLLQARIDDAPISHRDLLTICMTLMLAGLDTTRSALGYMFHHLATHPADRAVLIADPSQAGAATDEFIRLYPLVIQVGRRVTQDLDFDGCPMSSGDVVWLGLASANHDPRKFDEPDQFRLDRRNASQHLGFGAGRHRCLGMHLARAELAIALQQWHARIPDYRIAPGAELVERGGQLTLRNLPLEWRT